MLSIAYVDPNAPHPDEVARACRRARVASAGCWRGAVAITSAGCTWVIH